ncbi:sodium:proton exchanger [Acidobacteria bacterium Mor1]|nr:sodium:proton exchanger [Acidobacteria bacterium Mor1]
MGHLPLLDELVVVAALAVAVTILLSRFKLPTVAGLLAAGALMGPYGLRLATSIDSIEVLAEVGVVLLLFSIGLEFSLARLKDIFRRVALGGFLQVGLTAGIAALVATALGQPPGRATFYGFVFALSSTAIVLRALVERRELDAPHGRFIVGTLIFQDLCVVPMVLIVPLLAQAGSAGGAAGAVLMALGKAALVLIGIVAVSRFVVPKLLALVDASRSREVFLIAILGICIGTAWLTSHVGLSLALGAFLGGMVVADTEYGHRAMGDILPLRDAFVSLFFVLLGMLFDIRVVLAQPILVGGLLAGFLLAKGAVATLAAMAMRFPARVAWLAGVGLAQFGEFGFVLTQQAQASGLIGDTAVRPLLAAGVLSMFLTPILVRAAPHVTAGEKLLAPLERLIGVRGIDEAEPSHATLRDHVVLIGFGLAGRLAARSLREIDKPFVGLELNSDNVRSARAEGLPVYYADATSTEALHHAHVEDAQLVVVLINDPAAAQRTVDTVNRVAPDVPILIRSHYLLEREPLLKLGARDVVAEEVEGAVEVIARMLRRIEVPRNVIEERIRDVRAISQTSDRRQTIPRSRVGETRGLDELKVETVLVREGAPVVGKSPVSMRLRSVTGALVVGARRDGRLLQKPDPTESFHVGDEVYLLGTEEALDLAIDLFEPGTKQ